ncbi:MAG: hypothetical protein MN733_39830, partial [Nitrososphaera sp.]|nr:hypothetical protein [Nitrososphaera sp.]
AGRGGFQTVTSVCKKDSPNEDEWRGIQYAIFGCPNIWCVFQDGEIKNTNFMRSISRHEVELWIKNLNREILENFVFLQGNPTFSAELANLNEWIDSSANYHFLIKQTKLPSHEEAAYAMVETSKKEVIENGGEGLVLRDPVSVWTPKRVNAVLKVKGELDAEATLVGFTSGRNTTKGSKLLGMIGALVLDFDGKRLELSGLTDEERTFADKSSVCYATKNPGCEMPCGTQARHFKVGDTISFHYREMTDDGLPKEARYWRKRD